MRGWSSLLIGFFLLGLAYWSFAFEGLGSSTLLCGAAALVFFYRGAQGMAAGEAGDAGDPLAIVEFVSNPAEAIVDSATERLGECLRETKSAVTDWLGESKSAEAEPSGFDPDAVIARYLENRGEDRGAEPATHPVSAAPVRGFGRKGL